MNKSKDNNSEVMVFLKKLATNLDKRFDALEERMVAFEERMVALEERMAALEERMVALEERVAALEERITALEERVSSLEVRILGVERGQSDLGETVQSLATHMDNEFDSLAQMVQFQFNEQAKEIWSMYFRIDA